MPACLLFLFILWRSLPGQQLDNTREEDKTFGADPVARMLLGQSDDCSINSAAATVAAATVAAAATATAATTKEGDRGKDDDAGSSPGRDSDSPSPRAAGVVTDVGVASPHAFEVAGAGGGSAAASVFRSTAKGSSFGAPSTGLFSLGSRSAGFGDAIAVPQTRLFKPVAFRLP